MHSFERTIVVDSTPAKVFAALTDLDQVHHFMPDVVKVKPVTDLPFGTGFKWKETRQMKILGFIPVRMSATIEVTEFEKNKRYTTVADDGCNWAAYTFTTKSAAAGKTQVGLRGEFKMVGKYAAKQEKAARMRDWCEKADGALLDRLKAHVES